MQLRLAQMHVPGCGPPAGTVSQAHFEELETTREQLSEAHGRLAEAQADAAEEREAAAAALATLTEREEEVQLLYDMLARFQVRFCRKALAAGASTHAKDVPSPYSATHPLAGAARVPADTHGGGPSQNRCAAQAAG